MPRWGHGFGATPAKRRSGALDAVLVPLNLSIPGNRPYLTTGAPVCRAFLTTGAPVCRAYSFSQVVAATAAVVVRAQLAR